MAAARATLLEALTPEAYARVDALGAAAARRAGSGHRAGTACLARRDDRRQGLRDLPHRPVRNFRDFHQIDDRLGHLHWLVQHNGGVFLPPWGKVEQWLLSVQHDEDDVDRFVANLARSRRR